MINTNKPTPPQRIDERAFVELPFLEGLAALGWDVLDLEHQQAPEESYRENFNQVVMESVLRESLPRINPWLQPDQIADLVRRVTPSQGSLLETNRQILDLLLENTSVEENRETGQRDPTVRYVDFENLENNSFIAVCQFKLRIAGSEKHIYPDIVLFLNGLPVVVVECKSPKERDAIAAGIDQLLRYSEQRDSSGEGNRRLCYYNQFVVSTCRNRAVFGTISSREEKHFFRWSDPYPRTLEDIRTGESSPNDQQRLVAGMLDRRNLLDLIRSFTIFTEDDKGKRVKVVGRYQQFRAVKKTIARLKEGNNRVERSGIIWHTQGSGKSLTMVFLVREMRLHRELLDWKVVFVTDRTQLQEQLTTTSGAIGRKVSVASNIARLKELLPTDSSDLIMAMIHKFQERELETVIFPELNVSPKILILTDEAHRTQYSLLAANLERAMPNATEIAFTGTPIDKTERKYGDYIDRYTMRQSVEDGVTLEIVYEGRTHNAEVEDQEGADAMFEDIFSEWNISQRLRALGYGSRNAYLEAWETIRAKADDMIEHYVEHIFPNGYKAQVVAASREAAHRYGQALTEAVARKLAALEKHNPLCINLDRLRRLNVAVIISGYHNDRPHLKAHSDETKHRNQIRSFKLAFDFESDEGVRGDVGILVVNNMLLTGFDAPIEQVMYLDRVIIAHNLLQAIARVNRVAGDAKEKGFVVDYVGIGHHLKEALDNYYERELNEVLQTLHDPAEEIRALESARKRVWDLLNKHGVADFTDYDAFYDLFNDEDLRYEYILAFREFYKAFNLVLPRKEALAYLEEYLRFSDVNTQAAAHLYDERMSMKGVPEKLRRITDAYLRSKGIEQKVAPISIFDEEFLQQIEARRRIRTKAAEVEHAIRHHIENHKDEDPELYASFAEALRAILEQFKDNWQKIFEELEKLRQRIRTATSVPTYGLNSRQYPIFRNLSGILFNHREPSEDELSILLAITVEITELMGRELQLSGFWKNIPAQNRLKGEMQKILLAKEHVVLPDMFDKCDRIITRLMEYAQRYFD